ncbi:MAG: hypothetical protein RSC76_03865 [Oscillospiraceae bacterium]
MKLIVKGAIKGRVSGTTALQGRVSIKTTEVRDYCLLQNKPQISGVELLGGRTPKDLHLQEAMDSLTNEELENILK